MRRITSYLMLGLIFSVALSCGSGSQSGEDIKNITEITEGSKIGNFTVTEIHSEGYTRIVFEEEIVIEGKLEYYPFPAFYVITLTDTTEIGKIKIKDEIKNLKFDDLAFYELQDIGIYLPADYFEDIPDGKNMKQEYNGNIDIKAVVKNITFESGGMNDYSAEIVDILKINGEKPEIQTAKGIDTERTRKLIAVREGEQIEGLIVKAVDYQKGSHFSITFEDELELSGDLTYNDFEGIYDLNIKDNPFTTQFEDVSGTYDFMNVLNFKNMQEFSKVLTQEQKDKLMQEQAVEITVKVNNLTIGTAFDKGRLGTGAADFIELK